MITDSSLPQHTGMCGQFCSHDWEGMNWKRKMKSWRMEQVFQNWSEHTSDKVAMRFTGIKWEESILFFRDDMILNQSTHVLYHLNHQ